MFWGLQLESGKRYSQIVPEPFLLSKATLDVRCDGNKPVQVFVEHEGAEYAIATLKPGTIYDSSLNLEFNDGDDISFFIKGDGIVYLTGHTVAIDDQDESFYPAEDSDSDDDSDEEPKLVGSDGGSDSDEDESEEDEEDVNESQVAKQNGAKKMTKQEILQKMVAAERDEEDSDLDGEDFDEEDFDEEDFDEEDMSDFDEEEDSEEEEVFVKAGSKRSNGVSNGQSPTKKIKTDVKTPKKVETPAKKTPAKENKTPKQEQKTPKSEMKTPKQEMKTPKQEQKTPKQDQKTPKQDQKTPKQDQKTPKQQEKGTPKGNVTELNFNDVRVGSGPVAKPGKTVHVYYTGTLMNGKKFDSCTQGKPFSFRLGKGDVIQGWDQGISGMKVGGKRILTIPSHLAYGKKGVGPIPSNAALKFEVELKAVN